MSKDKAGEAYWSHIWKDNPPPKAVDPYARGLNNYVNRKFHEYFRETFSSIDTQDRALLEIGCARSAWLPYFAREFGFKVYGIDYSELGCQQAEQVLANEGVRGEIVHADFFSPPRHLLSAFDVVVSFGVVEHFEDTTACVTALSRFLKPGGLMITIIPNLVGMIGLIQKTLNRPVFDVHVPLDQDTLAVAHRSSPFEVVSCDYFLFASLLINIENWKGIPFYRNALRLVSLVDKMMWTAEENITLLRPNRWTSPYIACVAQKLCE